MTDQFIFKLLTQDQWASFQAEKSFRGAPVDLADGYIHFSTRSQVAETAAKYFSDLSAVVVAEIDVAALPKALTWEPARAGALFPHLYADLPLASVGRTSVLSRDSQGAFVFPGWARPR
tara:strand:+ start:1083 stop:1439 length:357 start_codon:yes stop_codon:yes gene_type:complete